MMKNYFLPSILAVALFSATNLKAQNITTYAGVLGIGTDDGSVSLPATSAHLKKPFSVFIASTTDNLYISDQNNNKIKEVLNVDHKLYSIGGNGIASWKDGRGDTALFNLTGGIFANYSGDTVYVTDVQNQVVRKMATSVSSAGYYFVTTIAGTVGSAGSTGDGTAATTAQLNNPYGVWLDLSHNIFIADAGNNKIRMIDHVTGNISTIAGTGTAGSAGDGANAAAAQLNSPTGVFVDSANNIYIADQGNNKIRKIDALTGNISTVAGNGTAGFGGDGLQATDPTTKLNKPTGVCVFAGSIYIADRDNNRIRKVDPTGKITTVAGNGTAGSGGDGGLATSANLNAPSGVYVYNGGISGIFIADQGNHAIRQVQLTAGVNDPMQSLRAALLPNPSAGQFTIKLPANFLTANVEIYNVVGTTVYSSKITNGKLQIDLSAQPAGVYLVHLNSGNATSVQKLIISK